MKGAVHLRGPTVSKLQKTGDHVYGVWIKLQQLFWASLENHQQVASFSRTTKTGNIGLQALRIPQHFYYPSLGSQLYSRNSSRKCIYPPFTKNTPHLIFFLGPYLNVSLVSSIECFAIGLTIYQRPCLVKKHKPKHLIFLFVWCFYSDLF